MEDIQASKAGYTSNGIPAVQADLAFSGESPILGPFNGTISANYQYVYVNGAWLIFQEDWDFLTFNFQPIP
jgi:hypothetical protein